MDNNCVHGNPLDAICTAKCEHFIQCGYTCKDCDREYLDMLHRLCVDAGKGDARQGRINIIKTLKDLQDV